jgi:hypothetical protein
MEELELGPRVAHAIQSENRKTLPEENVKAKARLAVWRSKKNG